MLNGGASKTYQKMRNNPDASPYLNQALTIAKFESGMYEVVETFLPFSGQSL